MVLGHKHVSGSITIGAMDNHFDAPYGQPQSIGTLALQGYNQKGWKNNNHIRHGGANGFKECVAYFAGPWIAISNLTGVDWSRAMLPGGCLNIPPSNEWCKITTPEIVLEHGAITLKQAEGDIASTSMGVECTTPTAVTFNLIAQDKYVYLDEGKSEVFVDNKPLNTKIDLPQGDSQMPVKDLLTGVTKEGFHTGSSVLVMMPY